MHVLITLNVQQQCLVVIIDISHLLNRVPLSIVCTYDPSTYGALAPHICVSPGSGHKHATLSAGSPADHPTQTASRNVSNCPLCVALPTNTAARRQWQPGCGTHKQRHPLRPRQYLAYKYTGYCRPTTVHSTLACLQSHDHQNKRVNAIVSYGTLCFTLTKLLLDWLKFSSKLFQHPN